jgi:hypothetical protein
MADAIEFAELLSVDVADLARLGALIAAHRIGRLERRQAVQAQPFQDTADSRRRNTDLARDRIAGAARPAQSRRPPPLWQAPFGSAERDQSQDGRQVEETDVRFRSFDRPLVDRI